MGGKRKKQASLSNGVEDFRHKEARRKNNPPAGIAPTYEVRERQARTYTYDPHLDPQLQWAGKVQMIYVDPPYGIKYSSNFQPRVDRRDVKDKDEDLTHEPEQIKAYRNTWKLGIHSYLTYLRDRLLLCRELLHESGSIFVQINDENLHLVRSLLDEVFGRENFGSGSV